MSKKYILGCDPGLANFGLVVTDFDFNIYEFEDVTTKKGRARLVSEDNMMRAQAVSRRIVEVFDKYDITMMCAEAMSAPRSASVAIKMAYMWGVLSYLAEQYSIPVLQESPQQIKKSMTGIISATKDDMLDKLKEIGYDIPKMAKAKLEHPVDSLCAILACKERQMFRAIAQSVKIAEGK